MNNPQPGRSSGTQTVTRRQMRGKDDNDGDSTAGHLHRFTVKFSTVDSVKYTIDCDQPRTVLEAIKSTESYKKMKKFSDENLVIQLGKAKAAVLATHFPCSCIRDGESLTITCESRKVEEVQDQRYKPIQSRDKYSVFYIDTVGGQFTKQKKLFRNNAVKNFKYLCVYGEKGMSVEEALKRDGRFIDLGNFKLSDNTDPDTITECTQLIDNLHGKRFKICLPRNMKAHSKNQQENFGASNNSKQKCDTTAVTDLVKQRGVSVREAMAEKSGSSVDTEEIYERLRQQFPDLKKWMESRFPDDSYQEELNLRTENFRKIQNSFSEVDRFQQLLKVGESVCKVVVEDVSEGTGFVLFDNFVLTNAHLFKGCIEGNKLRDDTRVYFIFKHDKSLPHTNYYYFQLAHHNICHSNGDLDYAILELNPESQKPNDTTQTEKMKVPPGFLKKFGPLPQNGEALIIGHPAGGVKNWDLACVIEKQNREQAVLNNLHPYKDTPFILHNIIHTLKEQGIESIMMGGYKADKVVTLNTFMYHGASGSPVFDARGRVFGLHTAGYGFFPELRESVIEYAQPLLTIFEDFVRKIIESRDEVLLKRVEKEVKCNSDLRKVFKSVVKLKEKHGILEEVKAEPGDPEELSDSTESMEICSGN